MGLFPYGKPNENIPKLFTEDLTNPLSNRNAIIPTYPNGAYVNKNFIEETRDRVDQNEDLKKLENALKNLLNKMTLLLLAQVWVRG